MYKRQALIIHLTLIPYLSASGELKTKPTQHSVKQLLELGIQPDVLVCRTEHHLDQGLREKIARFCNVSKNAVIESIDASTIYEVPLLMQEEKLDSVVLEKLDMQNNQEPNLDTWKSFLNNRTNFESEVTIGLIGKYVELKESYKSISEAFIHVGVENRCEVNLEWIHSDKITDDNVTAQLSKLDGILVAPGFGSRGIEGKITAIKYARENNLPFFGICLGMQCAVIEFARNVLGYKEAHTAEINPESAHPIINLMEEQKTIVDMGGTMRLGAYDCQLDKDSNIFNAYGKENISERHRHRYEFNAKYLDEVQNNGMKATGINPKTNLVEVVEIPSHPWFVGVQFHPEYKSTVENPHPLFSALSLIHI